MAVKERQLRVAGSLDNVAVACDFVVEQAREAGLDERAIHHCYLAVDEACTNVIEHGYGQNCGDCIIDVICRYDEHALTIIIVDDSPAFDPLMRPDPNPSAPIAERATGGWGIFFIKKLMDRVSYSYEGQRNRLVMSQDIRKPSFPAASASALLPIDAIALTEKVGLITPIGRLDAAQSANLEAVLTAQLDAGRKWLILDMAGVDLITSAGLKMLVSVGQRVRDQKGDLALAALRPRVREVLQMIGLDLVFTLVETPDQARRLFVSKVK